MDHTKVKTILICSAIWLAIYCPTLILTCIGFSHFVVTAIYVLYIPSFIIALKIWNKHKQDPILDVNITHLETYISVALATIVAIFATILIQHEFISSQKFILFIIQTVIADSVFYLLKSKQPDAASPTHGFNRIIALSRPTYFSLLSVIILICNAYLKSPQVQSSQRPSLVFYKFDLLNRETIFIVETTCLYLLIAFPIIFTVGLLPQITTFLVYFFEQIDVHFFGATACTIGIKSAVYSFVRSILSITLLFIIALQSIGNQQYYSLFCGILVSLCFFLSRSTSDATVALRLSKRIVRSLYPVKRISEREKIELQEIHSSINQTRREDQETNQLTSGNQNEITTTNIECQHSANLNNPPTDDLESQREENDLNDIPASNRIQSKIDDICIYRLKCDFIKCICFTVIVFALHVTTIFTVYNTTIDKVFRYIIILWGLTFHFLVPQLRRDLPFSCIAKPMLKSKEYNFFEVKTHAKVMWFEKVYYWGIAIEKYLIYPIFWINVITQDTLLVRDTYGNHLGPLFIVIMSFKLIRQTFNDSSYNFITVLFAYLYFHYDVGKLNYNISLMNYFVFSILVLKIHELILKIQFILIYLAPWQIPWGSAFHAFAQPFSVPHSSLLFLQAIVSSILSAPLQPLMGSAIFVMSYVRPIKFWERDYNTNVIDINSTRLVNQLEKNRIDSNRLDGVFYEHLTKCLERRLCKDLSLGRWGPVSQGDCFAMAGDNLNCLVHIVELGNGVCTFQLRGLEFRGTYCQQQEVEAISESVSQNDGFCCFEIGHIPNVLSLNAAFNQHWLAWHVTHARYVLEGYSISDNLAAPMLQLFDLRRALVTYYVKSIIYFTITSVYLSKWLRKTEFHQALEHTKDQSYADLDPTFSSSLDLDFDLRLSGVTRAKFCSVYYDWIQYCVDRVKNDKRNSTRASLLSDFDCRPDSFLVSLCYGLSLLARRSLSAAVDGQQFHTVDSLLFGLLTLLKGDFRVTSLHDEWIFQEMKFFKLVVIPSVRMAMKLHQDHFAAPDEYDDNMMLYEAIAGYQKNLVISHETDVSWRDAILSGVPSLLTLRLYADDGNNQYKFIMLNKRYLSFRIIKINKECVRGLWASQQQELIYFRNTDPERGSIQNAKQALRNMINSSCDQPVGYPIYVSPLTTSYAESAPFMSFAQ